MFAVRVTFVAVPEALQPTWVSVPQTPEYIANPTIVGLVAVAENSKVVLAPELKEYHESEYVANWLAPQLG